MNKQANDGQEIRIIRRVLIEMNKRLLGVPGVPTRSATAVETTITEVYPSINYPATSFPPIYLE